MNAPEDSAFLLRMALEKGIGTKIAVGHTSPGLRSGLIAYFDQLGNTRGPVCRIVPHGLKRYKVQMSFGNYSTPCIDQMLSAPREQLLTARALLKQIPPKYKLTVCGESENNEWNITDGKFAIEATGPAIGNHGTFEALKEAATDTIIPILAAMAELIGYDENEVVIDENYMEGAISASLVIKRERSRRNRYLCLSIHGNRCAGCGFGIEELFGGACSIIEVHHLQPLSTLTTPREYDPRCDLVPLCPNCHRIVHLRKPTPYSLEELRLLLADGK
ncbi:MULTISPECIES: HNH endonuclease [Stenotrophomonas]|uniref:HNH endonuclease n=1 Tax=Stenotrophomonas TaxID=40323 RepID=UPI000AA7BF75|nr:MULTISPECIES: HNH endonuclease [Stenotrophomonas]